MAKKFFTLCMGLAMMTMLSVVTSCSKDGEVVIPIQVAVLAEAMNAEDLNIPQSTWDKILKDLFHQAISDANGTEASQMADAVKDNFKRRINESIDASEVDILRNSDMYFRIRVFNKADESLLSESRLYGSEL